MSTHSDEVFDGAQREWETEPDDTPIFHEPIFDEDDWEDYDGPYNP